VHSPLNSFAQTYSQCDCEAFGHEGGTLRSGTIVLTKR
jgi:hypothetical protein